MIRRAPGGATPLLLVALAWPGCRAYDARYWSFPFNSMQMVDDAALKPRTFGEALGLELLFQLFPWSWVVSAVDIFMLPVTLPYDFVELAASHDPPYPFEQQVRARRREGLEAPPPATAQAVTEAGGKLSRDRGAAHLDPAER